MQRIKGKKVSVERMNKRDEKKKDWKLLSTYTALVGGLTSYCSLIINLLVLIGVDNSLTKIVGIIMAIIIMAMLIFSSSNYKKVDRFLNKSLLNDILESFSLSGILGFCLEKIINLISDNKIEGMESFGLIFFNIMLLILPIMITYIMVHKKNWNVCVE